MFSIVTMREQVVRKAMGTGLQMVASPRTRTHLVAPSASSPTAATVTRTEGARAPVCAHHKQPQPSTPTHSRCVFTQTESASDDLSASVPPSPSHTHVDNTAHVRSFDEMPGPKGYPVVGTLLEYFRKENRGRMHEIQMRNHRQYGSIFKEPFGPAKNVCVADPAIVEEILRSEGQFPNRPPYESWLLYNNLRNKRGGLMTTQGEYWKTSRRSMVTKLMKPQSVGGYVEGMNETTEEFIARLRYLMSLQPDGQSVSSLPLEINKYTMEAVGRVLLNARLGTLEVDISPRIKEVIDAIGVMFLTGHQLMAFAKVHQIFRTKAWKDHVQAWDTIFSLSEGLMTEQVDAARQRLQENGPAAEDKMDLISHMVAAGTLTRDEIIENLTETFMGGVDTVANGVSFMLYLLSTNQAVQTKLREEVDTVLGPRPCTMTDLQAMPYVKAVVKETLRMFPPIPLNARVTQDDVVISNYRIPKGTIIMLNIYTMSHDPKIFPDPGSFIPDRWLRKEMASRNPFSAIPFGYGVRSCVGRRVSENLMYVAAIQMVQNFVLKKNPSFDITPMVRTQYTPGPELPVLFEER